jgi:phage terminase large subunit-like protein
MPSFRATFRNLNLNQRVETYSPFISRDVWRANGSPPKAVEEEKLKVWGGLDLSAVSDLTALVLTAEEGSVYSTFWLPEEGNREKSKNDRVPYDLWAQQGFLQLTPGKSIQYEYIAKRLREVFDKFDVQKIGFDRYNMKFLTPWLEKANFTKKELERFVEFGQGFLGMSPALRDLEVRLLEAQLKHGGHPVLTMCAANAVAISDPSGNRKLAKNKSVGRIDGMTALAMSIGVMMDPNKSGPSHKLVFI